MDGVSGVILGGLSSASRRGYIGQAWCTTDRQRYLLKQMVGMSVFRIFVCMGIALGSAASGLFDDCSDVSIRGRGTIYGNCVRQDGYIQGSRLDLSECYVNSGGNLESYEG